MPMMSRAITLLCIKKVCLIRGASALWAMRLKFLIKLIERDFKFNIKEHPSTFYYQLRESRPVIVTFHESVHLTTLSIYDEKTFSINSENTRPYM